MGGRKLVLAAGVSLAALCQGDAAWAQAAAAPVPNTGKPADNSDQTADQGQNDIVVTARRFEERLQDVPVSVTAVTSTDFLRQNITGLLDLASKVPGFSYEALSPAIVQPSIRGMTNLRVDSPVQNVAFYVDGIYLQRGYLIDQRLLNLDRVEIIKGPQSALYGRNAFAGAVNIITAAPSLSEARGNLIATVGSDERYEIRGFVSLPIIKDKLAIMIGGAASTFDGTWKNNHPLANDSAALTRGNLGGYDNQLFQARVIAKPVDALTLDALWIHTDRAEDSAPNYTISTAGTFTPFNTLNASPVNGANRLFVGKLPVNAVVAAGDTRLPGLVVDPRSFGVRGPTDVISAKATFAPGGPFSAVYQFGYSYGAITARGSVSNNPLSPLVLFGFNYGAIFDSSGSGSYFSGYSHDFRINYDASQRFKAFIGFNYSDTQDLSSNVTEFGPVNQIGGLFANSAFPIGPGLPFPAFNPVTYPQGLLQRLSYYRRDEQIYSPYAFVSWRPLEKLEVTLEARYTWEDHRGTDFLTREPTNTTLQALVPPQFFQKISYFTPRAALKYSITPDNNVYFSASRGVKAGNFNQGFQFSGQATYKSEDNWTYEIGSKNRFGPLTVNVAGFYTDWNNLQTGVVRLNANGLPPASFVGSVPSQVGNLRGVNVYGGELELNWRATRNLSLNLGAAYNAARYKSGTFSQRFGASGNCNGTVCSYTTVAGVPYPVLSLSGNQLERVPDFNGVAGFSWDGQFGNASRNRYFIRGDITYKTKQYMDEANLSFVPDRALGNLSAGVTLGNIELIAWVKNLTDEKYVSTSFFLIGTNGALSASYTPVLGELRTFGLTGNWKFGR
jgi:iron complex outermembrane receptor protein